MTRNTWAGSTSLVRETRRSGSGTLRNMSETIGSAASHITVVRPRMAQATNRKTEVNARLAPSGSSCSRCRLRIGIRVMVRYAPASR